MNYLSEFIGTLFLILIGNSVAYTVMGDGKNVKSYTVAVLGWGLAVTVAVILSKAIGGDAHLNPAVSVAFMFNNGIAISTGFAYIFLQIAGAIVGQVLTNFINQHNIKVLGVESLGAHATKAIKDKTKVAPFANELIATMILIAVVVFGIPAMKDMPSFFTPIIVGLTVSAIGFSFGSVTTWSINPARDLGPRIVYYFTHKLFKLDGSAFKASRFDYMWIPTIAPLCAGAIIGSFQYI